MIRLFFDTETNGLPAWRAPDSEQPNCFPLEIAAVLEDTASGGRRQYLSGLLNWSRVGLECRVGPELTDIHGITEKMLLDGLHPERALLTFLDMVNRADLVVGHNLEFDERIVRIWKAKLGIVGDEHSGMPPKRYCTMQASTELCRLPSPRGGFKWPKLAELHQFLFATGFDGAHGALADTLAARRCYIELEKRGVECRLAPMGGS